MEYFEDTATGGRIFEKVTIASLFDGIGGSPLCAILCGAVPVWASEIEPFPIKVTKIRFPNMKHYGDITKINGAEVEPVDIIIGGSPCQDLSVAGKRAGMKHSDFGDEESTRSGLFMEQIRIVKEMQSGTNRTQPRFMVWENVPGAFSSNDNEDFRAVLEETARIADPAVSIPRPQNGWANSGSILGDGFSISWRTVDAQYWGVPQRRRRIYLVADFGGLSAPEILFERKCMSWNFAKGECKRQGITGEIKNGFRTTVAYGISSFESNAMKSDNPKSGIYESDTARTIDQNGGNPACNQGGIMIVEMTSTKNTGSAELYEPMSCMDENWSKSKVKNAIRAEASKSSHAIVQPLDDMMVFEPRSQDGHARISKDGLCSTINTAQGGQRQPCIVEPASYTMLMREGCKGGGKEPLIQKERASTLTTSAQQTLFELSNREDVNTYSDSGSSVRRLTPLECERLQGYPDGWTNIPGATDSARYKSLGNSFAIPNAYFVISGCVEEIQKSRRKTTIAKDQYITIQKEDIK